MGRAAAGRRPTPGGSSPRVQPSGTPLAFPPHPVPPPVGPPRRLAGHDGAQAAPRAATGTPSGSSSTPTAPSLGCYVNFETPVRPRRATASRSTTSSSTSWSRPTASWRWKDVEDLAAVAGRPGRFTPGRAARASLAAAAERRPTLLDRGRPLVGAVGRLDARGWENRARDRPQRPRHPLRRRRPRRALVARAQDRARAAALDRGAQGPARPRHRRARRRRRGLRGGRRQGRPRLDRRPRAGHPPRREGAHRGVLPRSPGTSTSTRA